MCVQVMGCVHMFNLDVTVFLNRCKFDACVSASSIYKNVTDGVCEHATGVAVRLKIGCVCVRRCVQ